MFEPIIWTASIIGALGVSVVVSLTLGAALRRRQPTEQPTAPQLIQTVIPEQRRITVVPDPHGASATHRLRAVPAARQRGWQPNRSRTSALGDSGPHRIPTPPQPPRHAARFLPGTVTDTAVLPAITTDTAPSGDAA